MTEMLQLLKQKACTRTFGLPNGAKRDAVRHGYLLALEDVARLQQAAKPQHAA